jgi:hypothetical protein
MSLWPRTVRCSLLIVVVPWALAGGWCAADSGGAEEPIVPKEGVIRLFNGKDFDGLYTFLKDTKYEDPRHVFRVENGMVHISGDGLGTLITKKAYKNYHLVVEFKWGERTWQKRKAKSRDSGCLIHCNGPDGGRKGTWPQSFEAQIIEGGVGDILIVPATQGSATAIPVALTAEVAHDRDGETVWHKGGKRETFTTMHRVNWFGRDPDWDDSLGFRGKRDVDSQHGEWTRMDVIADGGHLQILVNGTLVNEAFDVVPNSGKILLQTELAEIWFRRWELYPLGKAPQFSPLSRE